jgi:hypothetical protein
MKIDIMKNGYNICIAKIEETLENLIKKIKEKEKEHLMIRGDRFLFLQCRKRKRFDRNRKTEGEDEKIKG